MGVRTNPAPTACTLPSPATLCYALEWNVSWPCYAPEWNVSWPAFTKLKGYASLIFPACIHLHPSGDRENPTMGLEYITWELVKMLTFTIIYTNKIALGRLCQWSMTQVHVLGWHFKNPLLGVDSKRRHFVVFGVVSLTEHFRMMLFGRSLGNTPPQLRIFYYEIFKAAIQF